MDEKTFFDTCLKQMNEKNGSDLHIQVGEWPRMRVNGQLASLQGVDPPTHDFLLKLLRAQVSDKYWAVFEAKGTVDYSISHETYGRYRVNAFNQKAELSFVIREVKSDVPNFEDLGLPAVMTQIAELHRGLVFVSGPVGSGKSTTMAAIINRINQTRAARIITLEDPIEYIYKSEKGLISQREVGMDVGSFSEALRGVVRQDPDVIVVGEIRDAATFEAAVMAAETGRLVISSVHSKNVMQTFERVLGLFPRSEQPQILTELAFNLKAVVSQRLLPREDGEGRVPVCEVLIGTASASKVIKENQLDKIQMIMQGGKAEGMQTLNNALLTLFKEGTISREDALNASDSPQQLDMNMKGIFMDESKGSILGG